MEEKKIVKIETYERLMELKSVIPEGTHTLYLNCWNLKEVPPLPESLRILHVGSHTIEKLLNLPKKLEELYCTYCSFVQFPQLPNSLKVLAQHYCTKKLTARPKFPDGLTQLILSAFNFELTTLPKNLKVLMLKHYHYDKLPTLPDSLETLEIDQCNYINYLPNIPKSLKSLQYGSCDLIEWKEEHLLPESLTSLFCCHSPNVRILPELPNKLKSLYCSNTGISELPDLPNTLETLACGKTNIEEIPELPETLIDLMCEDTLVSSLPELPDSLELLEVSHCNNLENLDLPNNLKRLKCDNCMNLYSISHMPESLNSLDCDNCEDLHLSYTYFPKTLESYFYSNCPNVKNILIFNPDIGYWVDSTSSLVFETNEHKRVIGYFHNDEIKPLNKKQIKLCKEYNFEYNVKCVQEAKSAPTCVICLVNEPSIMLNECHHLVYCSDCYTHVENLNCPKCRCENESIITVYL